MHLITLFRKEVQVESFKRLDENRHKKKQLKPAIITFKGLNIKRRQQTLQINEVAAESGALQNNAQKSTLPEVHSNLMRGRLMRQVWRTTV